MICGDGDQSGLVLRAANACGHSPSKLVCVYISSHSLKILQQSGGGGGGGGTNNSGGARRQSYLLLLVIFYAGIFHFCLANCLL